MTNADPSALSPRHRHRDADWEVRQPADGDVLIVGSGFSGICTGVRLRQAGIDSFLIIEKAEDLGGTWRDNRYPGCTYDVPSHLYSLSFAACSDWRRLYRAGHNVAIWPALSVTHRWQTRSAKRADFATVAA
jgi:cation diffusion facilitator CzcD-associated flavoprotein CzcO